jgi:hypothetical protein
MRNIPVYGIEKGKEKKIPLGTIVERRNKDRGNNIIGLLKVAASRFKPSPERMILLEFGGFQVRL